MKTVKIKPQMIDLEELEKALQESLTKFEGRIYPLKFEADHTLPLYVHVIDDIDNIQSFNELDIVMIDRLNQIVDEHNDRNNRIVNIMENPWAELISQMSIPELKSIDYFDDYTPKSKKEWKTSHFSEGAPMKRKKR